MLEGLGQPDGLRLGGTPDPNMQQVDLIEPDRSSYSVDPQAIGRMLDFVADLDRVKFASTDGSSRTMPAARCCIRGPQLPRPVSLIKTGRPTSRELPLYSLYSHSWSPKRRARACSLAASLRRR